MASAPTWNNGTTTYTLPMPDKEGEEVTLVSRSAMRQAQGGRIGVDVRPAYWHIKIPWTLLTPAEYATLKTAYTNCAGVVSTLTLSDGSSYSVLAAHYDFSGKRIYDVVDTVYTTIELEFDEVL